MDAIASESIGGDSALREERRIHPRRRAYKGATVTFNRGYGALEGLVRNISESGAMLRFGDAAAVPSIFELMISGDAGPRPARVCWRRGAEVGVAFEEQSA